MNGSDDSRGGGTQPASISVLPRNSNKRDLLFISPVVPDYDGIGLRKRVDMFLGALIEAFNVHLLIIPVIDPQLDFGNLPSALAQCTRVTTLSLAGKEDPSFRMISDMRDPKYRYAALAGYAKPLLLRYATAQVLGEVADLCSDLDYHLVHIARLYMAPFADPFLKREDPNRPVCMLDLDDFESRAHEAIARVSAANGDQATAYFEQAESTKYGLLEKRYLPLFGRVIVCSDQDRLDLSGPHPGVKFEVVPNGVRMPSALSPPVEDDPFRFLFVGSMDYFPNVDAMQFFCDEVLPKIRRGAGREFRLTIVGPSPTKAVLALARKHREVAVTGVVPDVRPFYGDANAVLVPVRVGGGMRIKVLEAFSLGRPVIATAFAVEGTSARHGEHYLEAEDADGFADACLAVMRQESAVSTMVENAKDLVGTRFSYEHVRSLIKSRYAEPFGDG